MEKPPEQQSLQSANRESSLALKKVILETQNLVLI